MVMITYSRKCITSIYIYIWVYYIYPMYVICTYPSTYGQALQLPPPCLFGGRATPDEVASAHVLRARAVCAMEEVGPGRAAAGIKRFFSMWVCLKMSCTPKPNGFADHYPYEKWLFHWEYSLFSDKPMFFQYFFPYYIEGSLIGWWFLGFY